MHLVQDADPAYSILIQPMFRENCLPEALANLISGLVRKESISDPHEKPPSKHVPSTNLADLEGEKDGVRRRRSRFYALDHVQTEILRIS